MKNRYIQHKKSDKIPQNVIPYLWSYDIKNIDLQKHKRIIIRQILNFGDEKSTHWLFRYYGRKKVRNIASKIPKGEWDKKSLYFWSTVLNIHPVERSLKFNKKVFFYEIVL